MKWRNELGWHSLVYRIKELQLLLATKTTVHGSILIYAYLDFAVVFFLQILSVYEQPSKLGQYQTSEQKVNYFLGSQGRGESRTTS